MLAASVAIAIGWTATENGPVELPLAPELREGNRAGGNDDEEGDNAGNNFQKRPHATSGKTPRVRTDPIRGADANKTFR